MSNLTSVITIITFAVTHQLSNAALSDLLGLINIHYLIDDYKVHTV